MSGRFLLAASALLIVSVMPVAAAINLPLPVSGDGPQCVLYSLSCCKRHLPLMTDIAEQVVAVEYGHTTLTVQADVCEGVWLEGEWAEFVNQPIRPGPSPDCVETNPPAVGFEVGSFHDYTTGGLSFYFVNGAAGACASTGVCLVSLGLPVCSWI